MKPIDPKDLEDYSFQPIGIVHSPYAQKFGVPRQPGLIKQVRAQIQLVNNPDITRSIAELDQFSHLWVIFVFHQHGSKNWKPTIRPPRLGGRQKVGSLSSRSPHRPNPVGISCVKIEGIQVLQDVGVVIDISGADLIDQTPVLDIKPYLSFCDSIPEAINGWASEAPTQVAVEWTDSAREELVQIQSEIGDLTASVNAIEEFLSQDPRPSFQQRRFPIEAPNSQGKQYGFEFLGLEVKYQIENQIFLIQKVCLASS